LGLGNNMAGIGLTVGLTLLLSFDCILLHSSISQNQKHLFRCAFVAYKPKSKKAGKSQTNTLMSARWEQKKISLLFKIQNFMFVKPIFLSTLK
jgi:hypothetical protein